MKNFYTSLYADITTIKKRALLFAVFISAIYSIATLKGSDLGQGLQVLLLTLTFLAGSGAVMIALTTRQHGLRNERAVIFSTLGLFVVLGISAVQAIVALGHGEGLIEQSLIRDSHGVMVSAALTLHPFVSTLILAVLWMISLDISRRIERKQKAIKGIQNKNLFK